MIIDFPEPWERAGQFAEDLVNELLREVTNRHPLWGKAVKAIARRTDSDDVLFELEGDSLAYAVVHLTWSEEPEDDPQWPNVRFFSSLNHWMHDGMK